MLLNGQTANQLRMNYGSRAVIKKVYAYDPNTKTASVLLSYSGLSRIDTVSLEELEALDENGNYLNVEAIVSRTALDLLPSL